MFANGQKVFEYEHTLFTKIFFEKELCYLFLHKLKW